jgi:hypothetical protein
MNQRARPIYVHIALFPLVAMACGGAMAPAASPAGAPSAVTESSAAPAAPAVQSDESAPVSTAAATKTSATPQAGAAPANSARADAPRALADFGGTEAAVFASLSDCVAACRALSSLESAARHICQMERGSDECTRVLQRATAARSRVEVACGRCPAR